MARALGALRFTDHRQPPPLGTPRAGNCNMITLSTAKFAFAGALIGAVARLASDWPDKQTITPLPADAITVSELPASKAADPAMAQAGLR
jgi:hypothetical protein